MNSAWAMLVRLMAVKNRVMLSPKNSPPGSTRRHVSADGAGRPVAARRVAITIHHSTTAPIIRQNASTEPGVSAHLTIVELLEKTKTASSIARMPTGANVGTHDRRRAVVAVAEVVTGPGCHAPFGADVPPGRPATRAPGIRPAPARGRRRVRGR